MAKRIRKPAQRQRAINSSISQDTQGAARLQALFDKAILGLDDNGKRPVFGKNELPSSDVSDEEINQNMLRDVTFMIEAGLDTKLPADDYGVIANFVTSFLMCVVVYKMNLLQINVYLLLFLQIITGALLYFTINALIKNPCLDYLKDIVKLFFKKRKSIK